MRCSPLPVVVEGVMFHVKHEWGGWVGEVDYLASTMSSPGVIEGLVFHVKHCFLLYDASNRIV